MSKVLLYNSQNGESIETNDKEIINLVDKLHEETNLGSVLLEDNIFDNEAILFFVNESKLKGICNVIRFSPNLPRPIQLMPVLSIQKDIEKLKKQPNSIIGEDLLNYLSEITINVSDQCNQKCQFCHEACKQLTYCTSSEDGKYSLKLEDLKLIANQILQAPIRRINIIGGDLSKYELMPELLDVFEKYNEVIHIWEYYQLNIIRYNGLLDILVDFPIEKSKFNVLLNEIKTKKTTFHFLVTNDVEVQEAESIVDECDLMNFELHPFFDNINIDFFKKNIYLNKEDIFVEPIVQRKIFCNQVLNSNHFGCLTIKSNGDVYANINASKLGNINDRKLLDIISSEISINTSWRVIRDQEPCSECLYQFLCPPPSNYEYIIGENSLCTVKFMRP